MKKMTCGKWISCLSVIAFLFCFQQIAFAALTQSKAAISSTPTISVAAATQQSSEPAVSQAPESTAPESPLGRSYGVRMPWPAPDGKNYLEWQDYDQKQMKKQSWYEGYSNLYNLSEEERAKVVKAATKWFAQTETRLIHWLKSKSLNSKSEIAFSTREVAFRYDAEKSQTFKVEFDRYRAYTDIPLYEKGLPPSFILNINALTFSANSKKALSFRFDAYKGTIAPASSSQWQALKAAHAQDPKSLNGKLYEAASLFMEGFSKDIRKFEPLAGPQTFSFTEMIPTENGGSYCKKGPDGQCYVRKLKFIMKQNKNGSWQYAPFEHNETGDPKAPVGSIARQVADLLRNIHTPYQYYHPVYLRYE